MTLKPIPCECIQKEIKAKRAKILKILRAKLNSQKTVEKQKVLKKTCFQIVKFLSSEGSLTLPDLNNIIHDLEKSILLVQSRKKTLVEKHSRRNR